MEPTGSNVSDRFLRGFGGRLPLFAREASARFDSTLLVRRARPHLLKAIPLRGTTLPMVNCIFWDCFPAQLIFCLTLFVFRCWPG